MKKLVFYLSFFLLAHPSFATSIVILITPDYILLGTDSRRMVTDYDTNENTYLSACKIRNLGQYCYAMAGLIASENTAYSADSIVAKNLASYGYDTAIANIKECIALALRKELNNRKQNYPGSIKDILASSEPILELAILRMKEGKPFVEITGFQISNNKSFTIKTYTSSAYPSKDMKANKMYMLGQYSGMETFLKEAHTSDPISLIDQMITAQSEATPTSVAKPINIIKYSKLGIEWIQ